MICANCGNQLRPGAKFCGKCGAKVVVERRCPKCNNLLMPDENFCTECGTKYESESTSTMTLQTQNTGAGVSQPSTVKSVSCCKNTIKGKMAIIDDNIYISDWRLTDNSIYCVPLSDNGEAREIVSKLDFANLFQTDRANILQFIVTRLYAWNGTLYFSAEILFDNQQMISETCYFHGIFSFCPKTNKLELVTRGSQDEHARTNIFFGDKYAFYFDKMDEEMGKAWIKALEAKFGGKRGLYSWKEEWYKDAQALVIFDLATSQETKSFMPMVAGRDWPGDDEGSGIIVTSWAGPIFHNGYIYASVSSSNGRSLRFPVNNPEAYEFLPLGTIISYNYGWPISLFAASGDVLMMPYSSNELIALSLSTLRPIGVFPADKFGYIYADVWQVFGNKYLACGDKDVKVVDVKNAKYLGKTDWRFVIHGEVIYDNIYHDNFTYALGRNFEYCEDVFGNEYPRTFDFGLYRIPWDVMFKKGTDVHKFFQPLF